MHDTALLNANLFFDIYTNKTSKAKILDIGSSALIESAPTLRSLVREDSVYLGMDLDSGPNVDIILQDTSRFPFPDNSFDFAVSTSCFEHDEFFWVTYLEIIRVLKPHGLFYLNAPSDGVYHTYPVDCWRFFPDSGKALAKWGKRNGYVNNEVVEHYTHKPIADIWNDYVCVFIKDSTYLNRYPDRMSNHTTHFNHGFIR
jgi:SAM-dependent methyltransferase